MRRLRSPCIGSKSRARFRFTGFFSLSFLGTHRRKLNMDSRERIINHLLRSTISNYVGRFIALGMWLLLTPFVLRHLETTLYGLWALIGSVTSYGYLLDFGISGA